MTLVSEAVILMAGKGARLGASAREAVAWTFGLKPDEYQPLVQS